jgi:hypothetical protein
MLNWAVRRWLTCLMGVVIFVGFLPVLCVWLVLDLLTYKKTKTNGWVVTRLDLTNG